MMQELEYMYKYGEKDIQVLNFEGLKTLCGLFKQDNTLSLNLLDELFRAFAPYVLYKESVKRKGQFIGFKWEFNDKAIFILDLIDKIQDRVCNKTEWEDGERTSKKYWKPFSEHMSSLAAKSFDSKYCFNIKEIEECFGLLTKEEEMSNKVLQTDIETNKKQQ